MGDVVMTKKNVNNTVSGVLVALVLSGAACTKENHNDTMGLVALLALAAQSNQGMYFRYSTNTRTTGGLSYDSANSGEADALLNIAGRSLSEYGDGGLDGYNDLFLTPIDITIYYSAKLLYKKEEYGGPAPGQESSTNADLILDGDEGNGGIYLSGEDPEFGVSANLQDLLDRVDWEVYDRIGLALYEFDYRFRASEMKYPVYRRTRLNVGIFNTNTDSGVKHDLITVLPHCNMDWDSGDEGYEDDAGFLTSYLRPDSLRIVVPDDPFLARFPYHPEGHFTSSWSFGDNTRPSVDYFNATGKFAGVCESLVHEVPDVGSEEKEDFLRFEIPSNEKRYITGANWEEAIDARGYIEVLSVNHDLLKSGKSLYIDVNPGNALFYEVANGAENPEVFDVTRDAPATAEGKDFAIHLPAMSVRYE